MSNQALMAWSVVVVAISFAALCVYLIVTLKAARETLVSVQGTIKEANQTVGMLHTKVEDLTNNVKVISEDVKNKIRSTDDFFQAARNAGVTLKETTGAVKDISSTLSRAVRQQVAALEPGPENKKTWTEWFKIGMNVVSAIRSAKQQNKEEKAIVAAERQEEEHRLYDSAAYVPEPFQPGSHRVYNGHSHN
ncbi:DUF948 domain-containing protein [Cohnella sp. GbtcB17]|uniref:DUF948 domain-containing protein n=1 Tax=Cohnella sp. GbtcB17 TaxID=2824762 RepID=UPI001C31094F|nr:DUF948 domain-containing protein [Cohnella sp. GbtcB17]